MADPKPPVPAPLVSARYVDADGRLTPEGHAFFAALARRLNDHEARLAALEP